MFIFTRYFLWYYLHGLEEIPQRKKSAMSFTLSVAEGREAKRNAK